MENEDLINVAMKVILYAGDARTNIKDALDATMAGNYEKADKDMADAKTNIENAHLMQTETIQKEARGEKIEYSTLFTHAQDTLMTIYSEMHLATSMIEMYKSLEKKISK